jgi:hypothetical protein
MVEECSRREHGGRMVGFATVSLEYGAIPGYGAAFAHL